MERIEPTTEIFVLIKKLSSVNNSVYSEVMILEYCINMSVLQTHNFLKCIQTAHNRKIFCAFFCISSFINNI